MYRFNIFIDLKSEEDMMHNLFSFNWFSYLFVIMQLKHINDNLCLSDHTIVNPFPHANTQKPWRNTIYQSIWQEPECLFGPELPDTSMSQE